ncbi:MAG: exo-alpha-sialidase [Lentisphaeria bacterium]|nr:exo-alpha-sialidase [Lentisphaeria bacterium]
MKPSLQTLAMSMAAPGTSENPRNTEASVLVRRDGSYLLAFTEFYGGGRDDSGANIVGLISRDGGESWCDRRILQENVGGCNVMSASLLRLRDGAVLLSYIRKDSRSACTLFSRRSEDDGETFGESVQINDWTAYMGCVNDSFLQLRSGRVFCPVYFTNGACWSGAEHFVARMCYSDDGGRSWQAARTDVDCPMRGTMEPVLLERDDGSLLMLMRTQTGNVYEALSMDEGETWGEAVPNSLPSQEAPIAVRRVPGGRTAVAVWNAAYDSDARSHGGRRSPLHIAVSQDGMQSVGTHFALEQSDSTTFSYPSIAFDGAKLLLTYYVGEDHALVDGGSTAMLGLRFRALDLKALTGETAAFPLETS